MTPEPRMFANTLPIYMCECFKKVTNFCPFISWLELAIVNWEYVCSQKWLNCRLKLNRSFLRHLKKPKSPTWIAGTSQYTNVRCRLEVISMSFSKKMPLCLATTEIQRMWNIIKTIKTVFLQVAPCKTRTRCLALPFWFKPSDLKTVRKIKVPENSKHSNYLLIITYYLLT